LLFTVPVFVKAIPSLPHLVDVTVGGVET